MTTVVLSNDDFQTSADDKNLEIFCLIWLDTNENIQETRDTEQRLRSIINHLKKFQDVNHCQQYIEQSSKNERLVVIVSGRLGREIVPSIHHLRQVMSIYVYCIDKAANEKWTNTFAKVKNVIVDLDELISQITEDHRIQEKVEEPLSINIFTTNVNGGTSTTGLNGQFVFYQVLIDCLLRLKSTETDKIEFINRCEIEYAGNHGELNNLREFEEKYSSNKALWWYTRESFFYRTLNAALRTQNIHMIFLYRPFIFDIYRQLQSYQSKNILKVYRSQMMSRDELKTLEKSLNQFISVNSFFSTSTNCRKALSFLGLSATSDNLERVLFEIQANPKMVTTKPFADISKCSEFANESEVLFMMGSIFRLKSICCGDDKIWTIQMTLCNDDEHNLKRVIKHMKQQIGSGETNLRTLGKVLWKMGKFDLAAKYFIRLLREIPSNDPLVGHLYEDLGELASQKGDYDVSIQWHRTLLEYKKQNESAVTSIKSKIYNLFGPLTSSTNTNINTNWKQNGSTIAGGNEQGNQLDQLDTPNGIYIDDDDQPIYIADYLNHRIVLWKQGAMNGQVIAGGNGEGSRMDQLSYPTNVIVDKKKRFSDHLRFWKQTSCTMALSKWYNWTNNHL